MVPVPLAETCSHLQLLLGADPAEWSTPRPPLACHPASLRHPLLCKGSGSWGSLAHWSSGAANGSPTPSGAFQRLPLSCAAVRALPATPTRGSPSIPPSSPAGRSAHTGAPARGRAGGGGRCCRCRSPSPSLRARPPCCGLCSRLLLSLWPKPSRASRRSSRGEGDTARRRGTAGSGKPDSEQGAPAAGRRQPSSLA